MKISKIICFMAIATAALTSCKKDEGVKSMAGTWEGRWGFGNDVPTFYENWKLESNGDLTAYDLNGGIYATGTWESHGELFEAQYSPVGEIYSYTFKGTYDDNLDEISGSWGETPSSVDGGTFEMYRGE